MLVSVFSVVPLLILLCYFLNARLQVNFPWWDNTFYSNELDMRWGLPQVHYLPISGHFEGSYPAYPLIATHACRQSACVQNIKETLERIQNNRNI